MNGISVIVCCFNSSLRLPKTIEHLAVQKASSSLAWEIIFVNNNSTDNTTEVINNEFKKYPLKEARYKIVDEPTAGLSFARDKGIETALYDLVVFCDDDNLLCDTYIETAYSILQGDKNIGAVGGQSTPATNAESFPEWFEKKKLHYAVGKQAFQSGEVSSGEYIYGAGMATRKNLFKKAFSHYKSLLQGRNGKLLASGDDYEYCMRLLFMGYKIFYDESLQFMHFIPKERLTEDYINRLGEGFKTSYEILSKYSLLFYLQSLTKIEKAKALLSSIIKFFLSSIADTTKWNKAYDSMVIYFLTNYRSKFVNQETMMIKAMYDEFKLAKTPAPPKSIGWFNGMRFDVFQTGI